MSVLHVVGGCGQTGKGQKLCAKRKATLVPGRELVVWWSKPRDPFKGGETVTVVRWPICTNGTIEAVLLPDRLNPPVIRHVEDPREAWPVEYQAWVLELECPYCDEGIPLVGKFERHHKRLTDSRRYLCLKHTPPLLYKRADGLWTSRTSPWLFWLDDGTGKPGKAFEPPK